jgi:DNA-binding XRE family transcriptional regulator
VGISANTLQRIESRKGSPSLAIAAALAVYFKIPAESLLRP